MFLKLRLTLLSLCLAAPLLSISHKASATDLQLSLSNEMVEMFAGWTFSNNMAVDTAWMYSNQDDINTNTLYAGFYATNRHANISYQFGGRVFAVTADKREAYGAAVGAQLKATFVEQLTLSASAYYAPDILTGGDFKNYADADFKLGWQLMPHANLFIGYRYTSAFGGKIEEISSKTIDFEPYSGVILGFRFAL